MGGSKKKYTLSTQYLFLHLTLVYLTNIYEYLTPSALLGTGHKTVEKMGTVPGFR